MDADLAIVGGGYTGLWTAIRAKERDPERSVVIVEASTIGWAASGRNGGFVDASLTHGEANGERRWPEEMRAARPHRRTPTSTRSRRRSRRYDMEVDFERTGTLSVALEPHELEWIEGPSTADDVYLDEDAVRAEVNSPTYPRRSLGQARRPRSCTPVGSPPNWHASPASSASSSSSARSFALIDDDGDAVLVRTDDGYVRAERVALATNVFPSLLKRNRLMTVPVYDYVLMTEPLSTRSSSPRSAGATARDSPTWRTSSTTTGSRPTTASCSAGTTRSTTPAAACDRPTRSGPRRSASWRATSSRRSRSSRGCGSATAGRAPSTPAPGSARSSAPPASGRVAYAAGFTGLGVASTRFAADVMLDKLAGETTELTELRMVRETPAPVPARAGGIHRHQPDPRVARPRRPSGGQAQHPAEDPGCRGHGVRLVTRRADAGSAPSRPRPSR